MIDLIITICILCSIIANFFLYEQVQDLKFIRELEKNSYKAWLEQETKAKRLYYNLYMRNKK